MIFVTLGSHDKPFNRLLEAVQEEIDKKNIKDEVIVQAGATKFSSKDMKIFDLISIQEFDDLVSRCDLLITHGGVGSIMTGLKKGKKVIACARLAKYKEVVNDHQRQIIENFDKAEQVIKSVIEQNPENINYISDLADVYIKEKKYDEAIELVKKVIDENEKYIYGYILGAKIAYLKGDLDKAKEFAQDAISLDIVPGAL